MLNSFKRSYSARNHVLRFLCALMLTVGSSLAAEPKAAPSAAVDILDLSLGTLLLPGTSEDDPASWPARAVFDDAKERGWGSAKGAAFPHEFVFELAQPYALSEWMVDSKAVQEDTYPGIAARKVQLSLSMESRNKGFKPVATIELAKGGDSKSVKLPEKTTARWLKISVLSNWGNPHSTQFMETAIQGVPIGLVPKVDFTGIFGTADGPIRFQQKGDAILGCYDYQQGQLTGRVKGSVATLQWRQEENKSSGTALVVLGKGGQSLGGEWYTTDGGFGGRWDGPKLKANEGPKCRPPSENPVATSLKNAKRAVLYGIRFATDSHVPLPESEDSLNEVLAVLKNQNTLRLEVQGHTDSTSTPTHNQALSTKRAEAVVKWLTDRGIAPARLRGKGYGSSHAVADNKTPQGRTLNRRVELVPME